MKIEVDFGNSQFKTTVTLSKDGSQWCALLGENIQSGIAGFGGTILEAISDFKSNVRNS